MYGSFYGFCTDLKMAIRNDNTSAATNCWLTLVDASSHTAGIGEEQATVATPPVHLPNKVFSNKGTWDGVLTTCSALCYAEQAVK